MKKSKSGQHLLWCVILLSDVVESWDYYIDHNWPLFTPFQTQL